MLSALLLERQKDIPQELVDEAINTRRGAESGFAHSWDICSWAALQSGPNLLSPSTGALDTPQYRHCPSLQKIMACAYYLVIWQVCRYVVEAKTIAHQGKLCRGGVVVAQYIASMPRMELCQQRWSGDLHTLHASWHMSTEAVGMCWQSREACTHCSTELSVQTMVKVQALPWKLSWLQMGRRKEPCARCRWTLQALYHGSEQVHCSGRHE